MVYYLNNNFLNCMIHNNASKITNDDKKSVESIVTKMVGESEFKNLIKLIGIKY